MLRRRKAEPNPFDVPPTPLEKDEVLPGYHLRRIDLYRWVGEPASRRWYVWMIVLLTAAVTALASTAFVRAIYRRKATAAIVVVNGVPIRRDRLMSELERRHGRDVVGRLVANELIQQFARLRQCWPSDRQVEERFKKEQAKPGFVESLLRANQTESDYKERLKLRLAEINLIVKGVDVTEAETRYFYERNIDPKNPGAIFGTPERVQVAVIGALTQKDAEDAKWDLVRDVPWYVVCAKYSVDASRAQAGLLSPIAQGESFLARNPAAEAKVFALREGDRTGPLQAAGKWWIVRCLKKWPARVTPWREARAEAEMGARIEKGVAVNAEKVAQDRAEFVRQTLIQVYDDAYTEVSRPFVSSPTVP